VLPVNFFTFFARKMKVFQLEMLSLNCFIGEMVRPYPWSSPSSCCSDDAFDATTSKVGPRDCNLNYLNPDPRCCT